MKDIYELLNDIKIDINDDDFASVSEIERKRISEGLKHRLKVKKQNKWKQSLSAAMITVGIMTSAMIGLSFTTFAEDIPFLGNIFKYFSNDGKYAEYDENANKLNLVQESNGVKISIMDTVFDGRTLFITYMIETNEDLGDRPWINSQPIYGDSGVGGSEQISKIDEGKYISVMNVEHYQPNYLDEIDVNWQIESISTEANNNGTVFEGNWAFDFTVKAVNSNDVTINKTIEDEGITFIAENMKITPMSFILSYQNKATKDIISNWDNLSVSVEVTDDLGNRYKELTETGGGWGSESHSMQWTATFEKLDPDAKKLMIAPIIELSDNDTIGYDDDGKPIKANYRSIDSKADYKEIRLDEIIVELK